MSETALDTNQLKDLLKTAIVEILQEQKEVFTDLIIEAMEDIALAKAMEKGENTEPVSRDAIFKTLQEQSTG
ncbi:hypothetical protein C7B76_30150 [filamentous cyanobacterium CCP2]|nr:hypothetical protein C7B76_30150 [filamentous cyanobacterium CCP2]